MNEVRQWPGAPAGAERSGGPSGSHHLTAVPVRPATPADYPAVALLTVAAYRADWQVTTGNPYERVLADVAGRAGAGELLVAVASERSSEASDAVGFTDPATGRVVGAVLFVLPGSRYAELAGPGEAEFRTLAVDPAAQGRGVGEALARACLDRAARHGCRTVRICTRDFAKTAHRLYERLGFVRTPERDWSPRRGVDLYALRLDLPAPAEADLPAPAEADLPAVAGGESGAAT